MNLRKVDLRKLNSATKYPSIPTYHAINPEPRKGDLLEEVQVKFEGEVVVTEKVDGVNARIILMPGGDWVIGSREELLTAGGDIVANPAFGMVDALSGVAWKAALDMNSTRIMVLYLELFGTKTTPAWKQYGGGEAQWRLFDVASMRPSVLDMELSLVAAWRDQGSQEFLDEESLRGTSERLGLKLTPRLWYDDAAHVPMSVQGMADWAGGNWPTTEVGYAEEGRCEGIVLRTKDRSAIAKVRHEDYQRTMRQRQAK